MEGASAIPVQEPASLPLNPPPPSTQTLPLPPHSPPVSADSRKRTFESNLSFTKYVKMRALVHDLHPRFVEVLGSPDFRNCKAAGEIREGNCSMRLSMPSISSAEADESLPKCVW